MSKFWDIKKPLDMWSAIGRSSPRSFKEVIGHLMLYKLRTFKETKFNTYIDILYKANIWS